LSSSSLPPLASKSPRSAAAKDAAMAEPTPLQPTTSASRRRVAGSALHAANETRAVEHVAQQTAIVSPQDGVAGTGDSRSQTSIDETVDFEAS
jgi:hypothetical protein